MTSVFCESCARYRVYFNFIGVFHLQTECFIPNPLCRLHRVVSSLTLMYGNWLGTWNVIRKGKFYYSQKCITVKVQDNNTVIAYPANSRCCSREISDVLRKPNVHYRIHNRPPLVLSWDWSCSYYCRNTILWILYILTLFHCRFLQCFIVNVSFHHIISPFRKTPSASSSSRISSL